ncbi:MAG: aspartate carbamoyltransferase regulatory subunit [Bacteroidales bacterium]|nr:aspartate carbamoyltransferase regulatory subunit [Bacteroidales bacterium]MBK7174888.1 aspartate carbamoyltransferase regulatory subunit [Bacteroidales bacterium]
MENKKQLNVTAIENGTVIDHIPANNVFKVLHILDIENNKNQVLFGDNLVSKKHGRKGLIKVSNTFFDKNEINKIALVAPTATIIEIRDFEVISKKQVQVPDTIVNIVKCFNPNCITNVEQISTRFTVIDKETLKLQCHYCEKITVRNNIVFL